jgi:ribosomal protein S18 acetylase RimI-like enzyme
LDSAIGLRAYQSADGDALVSLWCETRRLEMPWAGRCYGLDELRNVFFNFMEKQERIFVAHDGGRLIGFAATEDDRLTQLYVSVADQRRGAGGALLAGAMERAKFRLRLHVYERNYAARRLYERYGFRRFGSETRDAAGEVELSYEWLRPLRQCR